MTYGAFPYGSAPYGGLDAIVGRSLTIEERIKFSLFGYVAAMDVDGDPPLAWPNNAFEPPPTYLRVEQVPSENERMFFKGADPHRRYGVLRLTVVSPLNVGPTFATRLAGLVAENFPDDLALYDYGIKVTIAEAATVNSAFKTDVSWDVPVTIPYQTFA